MKPQPGIHAFLVLGIWGKLRTRMPYNGTIEFVRKPGFYIHYQYLGIGAKGSFRKHNRPTSAQNYWGWAMCRYRQWRRRAVAWIVLSDEDDWLEAQGTANEHGAVHLRLSADKGARMLASQLDTPGKKQKTAVESSSSTKPSPPSSSSASSSSASSSSASPSGLDQWLDTVEA